LKVRIKFSKQGEMRFIGHLDLMRFFQKVIRCSGTDIRYSEGMSPHMIMSFASPLGVGLTSDGEYVDIEVNSWTGREDLLERLNASSVPEIRFLDAVPVPEGREDKAMSMVAAASYNVSFREGKEPSCCWKERVGPFLAQDVIEIEKISKKAAKKAEMKTRRYGKKMADPGTFIRKINIRPLIYRMDLSGQCISMLVSSGSEVNLRPEEVLAAFGAFIGETVAFSDLQINRTDLYARDRENELSFIPLNKV